MLVTETSRTRRVNIVVNETLIQWASTTAESRGISVSALVREALEKERKRYREEAIEKAAESLVSLYSTDQNLVAYTALDGEDFA